MTKMSDEVVAELCSTTEYLLDRGEVGDELMAVLTHIRYTGINEADHFDVIWKGRVVRVTAEELGEAKTLIPKDVLAQEITDEDIWFEWFPEDFPEDG